MQFCVAGADGLYGPFGHISVYHSLDCFLVAASIEVGKRSWWMNAATNIHAVHERFISYSWATHSIYIAGPKPFIRYSFAIHWLCVSYPLAIHLLCIRYELFTPFIDIQQPVITYSLAIHLPFICYALAIHWPFIGYSLAIHLLLSSYSLSTHYCRVGLGGVL